jgi:hypothetical protein
VDVMAAEREIIYGFGKKAIMEKRSYPRTFLILNQTTFI